MKITTAYPVQTMDGKTQRMSFYSNSKGTFSRERGAKPSNPASVDQKKIHTFMTLAARNWDDLSEAQRTAWDAYATQYFPAKDALAPVGKQGLATYIKANVTRQILGLALLTDAPVEAPPAPLTDLSVEASAGTQDLQLHADLTG